MNNDPISEMILEREARVEKYRAQIESLSAEIKVLREAQSRTNTVARPPMVSQGLVNTHIDTRGHVTLAVDGFPIRIRDRQLSGLWRDVLRFVAKRPETTLHDIMGYSAQKGLDIKYDSLRSQLAGYVNNGLLERVRDGVFKITSHGLDKIGGASDIFD